MKIELPTFIGALLADGFPARQRALVYYNDSQISALSVTCRHGQSVPSIHVAVRGLATRTNPPKERLQRSQVFCVSQQGDGRVLALICILMVAACGLFAAPTWSVPIAALALATLSYARHQALFRRATDLGMQSAIDQTLVGSLLNGLAASAVAYGCGAALRFLSLGSL